METYHYFENGELTKVFFSRQEALKRLKEVWSLFTDGLNPESNRYTIDDQDLFVTHPLNHLQLLIEDERGQENRYEIFKDLNADSTYAIGSWL